MGDLKLLEKIQHRLTQAVACMEELPYVVRLNSLKLFSSEGGLLYVDTILMWRMFITQFSINIDDLSTLCMAIESLGTLDVQKIFCSSHWNNLSPHTVGSSSSEQFESHSATDLGEKLFEIAWSIHIIHTLHVYSIIVCFIHFL